MPTSTDNGTHGFTMGLLILLGGFEILSSKKSASSILSLLSIPFGVRFSSFCALENPRFVVSDMAVVVSDCEL